jgi:predicted phosphoribosyltransferase
MSATMHRFADRCSAGTELAQAVRELKLSQPILVLALPRGGVPVAYEVARALHAPLDVMVVRKIGLPGQPELAIGAIASGSITVRQCAIASKLLPPGISFDQLAQRERTELERREHAYRHGRAPLDLRGRTVVLVDDGLATGATMLAAVRATIASGAARLVVAAPVASREAVALIRRETNDVVVLETPPALFSISDWYEDFEQIPDAEVCTLLEGATAETP